MWSVACIGDWWGSLRAPGFQAQGFSILFAQKGGPSFDFAQGRLFGDDKQDEQTTATE
jgi:hypothetical protein